MCSRIGHCWWAYLALQTCSAATSPSVTNTAQNARCRGSRTIFHKSSSGRPAERRRGRPVPKAELIRRVACYHAIIASSDSTSRSQRAFTSGIEGSGFEITPRTTTKENPKRLRGPVCLSRGGTRRFRGTLQAKSAIRRDADDVTRILWNVIGGLQGDGIRYCLGSSAMWCGLPASGVQGFQDEKKSQAFTSHC